MQALKEARTAKGISKVAIARSLGIARQTYASYEEHPEKMSVEQAKAVCDFIGCDMDDIFFAAKG